MTDDVMSRALVVVVALYSVYTLSLKDAYSNYCYEPRLCSKTLLYRAVRMIGSLYHICVHFMSWGCEPD